MKDAATELNALAERVEQAEPHMQGVLLDRAWDELAECSAVFRRFAVAHQPGFDNNAGKFAMALEARAYESAAMMLVPEGAGVRLLRYWVSHIEGPVWMASVTSPTKRPGVIVGVDENECWDALDPALALAAAALRAHAAIAGEG